MMETTNHVKMLKGHYYHTPQAPPPKIAADLFGQHRLKCQVLGSNSTFWQGSCLNQKHGKHPFWQGVVPPIGRGM